MNGDFLFLPPLHGNGRGAGKWESGRRGDKHLLKQLRDQPAEGGGRGEQEPATSEI